MAAPRTSAPVRLAELVATLSLAADLGLGQPMEHCLRQTIIALRLADRVGVDESELVATYYAGLLRNVYCHADAHEQAKWFGDDIALKATGYESPLGALRMIGSGDRGLARAGRIASFPVSGIREARRFLVTHSTLAAEFARRIGLDGTARESLRTSYERWDGKGEPNRVKGEAIPLPSRLVTLTSSAEVYNRLGGIERAREWARKQRGRELDPALADLFCAEALHLLAHLDEVSSWDAVLDAEPRLSRSVSGSELDDVLEAMADLVDLKSPHLAGHSRGVANLAAEASRLSGLAPEEVTVVRRAGFVHDLGRLGVSNAIWDKPGPLTDGELERVRLHPYLADRMLARVDALARVRELAARHHERLDGSGYPRGLAAASLTPSDRLLAAADVYHALTEPRPYRPARAPEEAADELRAEVKAGRLDGEAVNAVLRAAGHRAPARRDWPAGLTAREVEVLGLLARGHSNKGIAQRLVVTPKTSKETAPNVTQFEGIVDDRFEVLDGQHISFTSFESDVDGAPLLKGLPGDQYHCPHWGYVLKGSIGFRFGDREEIYEAGDAFYVPPGHIPFGYAGGEMVMFQPSEEMAKTVETMKRNMEAATAHAH